MPHMHVLGNVGTREVNNSSLLLEFLILVDGQFGWLKNLVDLLLNKVILKNNVQKEASLRRISLAGLLQLDALNGIISGGIKVVNYGLAQILTICEAERSSLLGHVVNFHARGAGVVPILVALGCHSDLLR
jgi:hypothetical protein